MFISCDLNFACSEMAYGGQLLLDLLHIKQKGRVSFPRMFVLYIVALLFKIIIPEHDTVIWIK